ncbi:tRNA1(Val) (adenine(37)-N6)-methyltransferase [Pisciglobus halotolerans]|uniref:tRNA1(Val) A37 N6-methylase TrmN6 n=1 Tax=Pisciglobus halotolerans TaxID=745365 RepID=A0A1I3CN41_9LACT|nr:tRNA1(Val) (adenine(37)-N6)-methyltransferase [Pisciglobus halotolerans]SFH75907.1 tRNA1(Val) A37 N6-methylase TrmN6 [Pisciglobus halotolerans]
MKQWLQDDERMDQLLSHHLEIIQSPSVFSFSLDAVLLADFAQVPKHERAKIVDLCAGNGVVGLLLSQKTKSSIVGIELQPRLVDMAKRSIEINGLEKQLSIIEGNLSEAASWIKKDTVDVVTCNPPYFAATEKSTRNPNQHLAIARHELYTNLEEVIKVTSGLLKMNGKAYFVHRPDRLLEILETMKQHRLAPKKIRFVYPKKDREANTVLVEGIKDGKETGFRVLPPLFVYSEDNQYLPEVRRLLYGEE